MQHVDEIRARERAFQIWLDAGQPEGQHEAHWHQALHELGLDGMSATAPDSSNGVQFGGATLVAAGKAPPPPEPNIELPRK